MIKSLRNLDKGNMIDMAIGIVIGAAFGAGDHGIVNGFKSCHRWLTQGSSWRVGVSSAD